MMDRNLLIVAMAGLLLAGCVERRISITSEPAGALVHLNDQEVGRTPLTVPFTWYGTYDVRLEADGYQPLWTEAKAKQPLWDLPGPDLIAEAIPDAKSEIKWHFVMEPKGEIDSDAVRARAIRMRNAVTGGEEMDDAELEAIRQEAAQKSTGPVKQTENVEEE